MAKLMFRVCCRWLLANFSAFSFAATTPTTLTTGGQERSATVAGLNGRADLQEARIVQNAAERAYYPVVTVKSDVSSP